MAIARRANMQTVIAQQVCCAQKIGFRLQHDLIGSAVTRNPGAEFLSLIPPTTPSHPLSPSTQSRCQHGRPSQRVRQASEAWYPTEPIRSIGEERAEERVDPRRDSEEGLSRGFNDDALQARQKCCPSHPHQHYDSKPDEDDPADAVAAASSSSHKRRQSGIIAAYRQLVEMQ